MRRDGKLPPVCAVAVHFCPFLSISRDEDLEVCAAKPTNLNWSWSLALEADRLNPWPSRKSLASRSPLALAVPGSNLAARPVGCCAQPGLRTQPGHSSDLFNLLLHPHPLCYHTSISPVLSIAKASLALWLLSEERSQSIFLPGSRPLLHQAKPTSSPGSIQLTPVSILFNQKPSQLRPMDSLC